MTHYGMLSYTNNPSIALSSITLQHVTTSNYNIDSHYSGLVHVFFVKFYAAFCLLLRQQSTLCLLICNQAVTSQYPIHFPIISFSKLFRFTALVGAH